MAVIEFGGLVIGRIVNRKLVTLRVWGLHGMVGLVAAAKPSKLVMGVFIICKWVACGDGGRRDSGADGDRQPCLCWCVRYVYRCVRCVYIHGSLRTANYRRVIGGHAG